MIDFNIIINGIEVLDKSISENKASMGSNADRLTNKKHNNRDNWAMQTLLLHIDLLVIRGSALLKSI